MLEFGKINVVNKKFRECFMLTIKEAKKLPFEVFDDESKDYFYDLFKKYVVRKKIADNNKYLTSLFAKRLGHNPREYAHCFNELNSDFVASNLIGQLSYDEIHTTYLKKMTEDQFNAYLNRTGNSFDRKIALMCFSMRPSERIANRVTYPVMLAYANMQDLVIQRIISEPKVKLSQIFADSAKKVRADFVSQTGHKINNTQIASTRTDYKALGKKCAPIWREMLEFYSSNLPSNKPFESLNFVRNNFVFMDKDLKEFDEKINAIVIETENGINSERLTAQSFAEEYPDEYIPADIDELYSDNYVNTAYFEAFKDSLEEVFQKHLRDPIFLEASPKTKDK